MAQQVARDMKFMRRVNEWQQYLQRHHDRVMLLQEIACMRRPILSFFYISAWYSIWAFFTLTSLSMMTKVVVAVTSVALADAALLWLRARVSSNVVVRSLHDRVPLVARQPWQLPLRSVQELASCLAHIQQWKEDTAAHVAEIQRTRLGTFTFVLVMASLFLAWAFSIFSDTTHLFLLVTACVLTPFVERIYAVHRHWPVVRAVAYNIFGRLANMTAFILARLPARGIVYDPNANVEPIRVHDTEKPSASAASSTADAASSSSASTTGHANVTERRRAARSKTAAARSKDNAPATGAMASTTATSSTTPLSSGRTGAAGSGLLGSTWLTPKAPGNEKTEHSDGEAEQSGLTLEEELRRAQMPDEDPVASKAKGTQPKASALPKPSTAPFYPTWKKDAKSTASPASTTTTTAAAKPAAPTSSSSSSSSSAAAAAAAGAAVSATGAAEASKTKVQPLATAAPTADARKKDEPSKLSFGKATDTASSATTEKTTAKTAAAATGTARGGASGDSGTTALSSYSARLFGFGGKTGNKAGSRSKDTEAAVDKTKDKDKTGGAMKPMTSTAAGDGSDKKTANPAAACSEVVLAGTTAQEKVGTTTADRAGAADKPKAPRPFSGGRLASGIPSFKDFDSGKLGGSKPGAGRESTASKDADDKTPTAGDANKNAGAGRKPLSSSPPTFSLGKEQDKKPPFSFSFGSSKAASDAGSSASTTASATTASKGGSTTTTTAMTEKNVRTGYVASKFSFGSKPTAPSTSTTTAKQGTDAPKPSPFTFSSKGGLGTAGDSSTSSSNNTNNKGEKGEPSLSALLGTLGDDDDEGGFGNAKSGGNGSKDSDKVVASTPRVPAGTGGGNLIDISMGFNDAMKDTDNIPDPLSDFFMKEDADEDALVVTSPSRGSGTDQAEQAAKREEDESYDPDDNTSSY